MYLIEGMTADEVWRKVAEQINSAPETSRQKGRGGETKELLHTCLVIKNPIERWVLNRRPAMNPAFALAEVVWILSGRNDSGFLNYWNPVLPRFQGRGPLYYGAYGQRLRYRFGIDQIRNACESLHFNPDSRQIVLQIWDASSDLPMDNGKARNEDIPCNICSLLKVREGHLEWVQIMRSNDLILGLPHNFIQFTVLQEMMAVWLGLETGSYIHFSDSLHIYLDQLNEINNLSTVELALNTDRWELPYAETMDQIEDIGRRMDEIRNSGRDLKVIQKQGNHDCTSQAATNILTLISADAALKAKSPEIANDLANRCTNPILCQLWRQWFDRRQFSPGNA